MHCASTSLQCIPFSQQRVTQNTLRCSASLVVGCMQSRPHLPTTKQLYCITHERNPMDHGCSESHRLKARELLPPARQERHVHYTCRQHAMWHVCENVALFWIQGPFETLRHLQARDWCLQCIQPIKIRRSTIRKLMKATIPPHTMQSLHLMWLAIHRLCAHTYRSIISLIASVAHVQNAVVQGLRQVQYFKHTLHPRIHHSSTGPICERIQFWDAW